jgi:surfeit locus 1 family protein
MSSTPAETGLPRRFRFRRWPALVTLAGLAVLVSLGTWQVQRLAWKRELIATAEAQLARPAAELPAGDDLAEADFRRFRVRGRYLHDRSLAFGLQASGNEPGALLVTPFRLDDGRLILIARGWLPERLLPPGVPPELSPEGERTLEGVARWRAEPGRNWLTPDDQPQRRRWFAWDIPAMAEAMDLPLLPLVLTLDRSDGSGGQPKAMPARTEFQNNHLGYAITWYGLAAGLLAVYLLFSFQRDDDGRTP